MIEQLLERWHQLEPTQCQFNGNWFSIKLPDQSIMEWDLASEYNDESLLEQAIKFAIRNHRVEIFAVDIPIDNDYKFRVSIIETKTRNTYSAGIKSSPSVALLSSYVTFLSAKYDPRTGKVLSASTRY